MLKIHPAALIFPMLDSAALAALAEDIAAHGLREPLVLLDGQVLDGRNRLAACELAGVDIVTRSLHGCDSPTAYVLSANLHRRHLTSAQRTAVALDAEPGLAREAKERQRSGGVAGGKEAGRGRPKASPLIRGNPLPKTGEAARQAAALAKVGHNQVEQLKRAVERAPEVLDAVRSGQLRVAEAVVLAALDAEQRAVALDAVRDGAKPREALRQAKREALAARALAEPSGTYRVIYADPPWSYGDERAGLAGYEGTAAADHYPTMPTADICALPVRDWCDADAVLFCWATFPLLPDALEVLRAWGFRYKTAFVWTKGRGSMGHYHDASCELLLVATRGGGVPDVDKRERQMQQWPRPKGHSRKPEEARQMIERLYTHGRRLELFRRGDAPEGWDVWGNEAQS